MRWINEFKRELDLKESMKRIKAYTWYKNNKPYKLHTQTGLAKEFRSTEFIKWGI